MTPWDRFLKELGFNQELSIVGPMMQGSHNVRQPTIYVDGGAGARGPHEGAGGYPTVSVGDGDSAKVPLDVKLPQAKDFSDLAFVLRTLPLHVRFVEMLGFMGGRPDHQLANFGEVALFLNRRAEFSTVKFDNAVVGFSSGPLQMQIEGPFSLLTLEACDVTIHGSCRYPLVRPTRFDPLSSYGISNVGEGLVTFTATRAAFLFFKIPV